MAYQVPPQWAHGDQPTATDMNKYSDALNAIHDKASDRAINFGAPRKQANLLGQTIQLGNEFWFIHKHRRLWFTGKGKISSTDGTKSTSISVDSGWSSYDLDSIDWLAYGMRYQVSGVTSCLEW